MGVVANLVVKVTGDTKGLDKDLAGLGSSMGTADKAALGLSASVGKMAAALGLVGLADKALGVVTNLARDAIASAGALVDMSAKTGLTTETLQRMGYVAKQSGVELSAFTDAAFMLGVRIQQGKGNIDGLGMSFDQLRKMSPDEQFEKVVDALSRMEDPQKRNALAVELFGRSAKNILPAIADGYSRIADEANIASDAQIHAIDRASDAWDAFVDRRKSDMTQLLGNMVLAGGAASELSLTQMAGLIATGASPGALLSVLSGKKGPVQDINLPVDSKNVAAGTTGRTGGGTPKIDREAMEWARFLADITGGSAVAEAEKWMRALDQVGGLTHLTADAQERLNRVLEKGLEGYGAMQRVAPKAMFDTWLATSLPTLTSGLPGGIGQQLSLPTAPLPPIPGFNVTDGLPSGIGQSLGVPTMPAGPSIFAQIFGNKKEFASGLSGVIMQALTGGGGVGKSIGGFMGGNLGSFAGKALSALPGMIGGALGSIIPGLGTMLGSVLGGLVGKLFGPTEYEKRVRAEAQERQQIVAGADMSQLQFQAAMTGRGDLLQQFQNVQTTAAPAYLQGLLTDLEARHERLNAAMDRYGISWEMLGEKAKQANIDQMAIQFIQDFEVLSQAGMDVNLIIEKMSGSVNEFIQTAIRTGTEVPAAMRPMLEQMASMGLLVDETGAKIELESLNWATTMSQGFQSVVEAINHLTRALGYDLPLAAQQGAAGVQAAFDGIKGPDLGGGGWRPGDAMPNPGYTANVDAAMASGGIVTRPTVALIGEAGPEAVIPLGSSFSGGGGNVYLDSDRVGRVLWPSMIGEAQRLGVS